MEVRMKETEIRIAAAKLGPGFRGERENLSDEERTEAAKELLREWERNALGAPPAYLIEIAHGVHPSWRDRKAKLFEIGEYSDKSLTARQEDLVRLAQNFSCAWMICLQGVILFLLKFSSVRGSSFG